MEIPALGGNLREIHRIHQRGAVSRMCWPTKQAVVSSLPVRTNIQVALKVRYSNRERFSPQGLPGRALGPKYFLFWHLDPLD